jgi:hypothetical protein
MSSAQQNTAAHALHKDNVAVQYYHISASGNVKVVPVTKIECKSATNVRLHPPSALHCV